MILPLFHLRYTPEPQDELTSSAIPPTLSSSRMLHRLVVITHTHPSNPCFSASLDLSPELPQLQTINLRDIINPRRAQRSDTPEVPELQTINLRDISNKARDASPGNNTPEIPANHTLVQTSSDKRDEPKETPEVPELSCNYRFDQQSDWASHSFSIFPTGALLQERRATHQRRQDFCQEKIGHS